VSDTKGQLLFLSKDVNYHRFHRVIERSCFCRRGSTPTPAPKLLRPLSRRLFLLFLPILPILFLPSTLPLFPTFPILIYLFLPLPHRSAATWPHMLHLYS